MEYTVIGFPRIGEKRELKFATERYWRGEIDESALRNVVRQQRAAQWLQQQEAGEKWIPSNDYSLYDGMLDTSFMLNAIPAKYEALGLSELDTYYAMARGYQGKKGDVRALTMKKWFNTNYHYLVPELEKGMNLTLRPDRFLEGFTQAKALGITTKPVVIGPFTFLQLAKPAGDAPVHMTADGADPNAAESCPACGCTGPEPSQSGADGKAAFIPALAKAYRQLLQAAAAAGAEWVQIDEPYLVQDLSEEEISVFRDLYQEILAEKTGVKVLLQTYFGDVRDCYGVLTELPFDGIGLDFVEGRQTASLIAEYGFPSDKVLFAGLVNGKNIWRCDYAKVLAELHACRESGAEVVLSTSCSLLHVPYTVENETQLPDEVKRHFSFAREKLEEMRQLCRLSDPGEDALQDDPDWLANRELFGHSDLRTHVGVQAAVAGLTEADFTRTMPRQERQALQRQQQGLPLLPTTTIGSFPQTKEVKANRSRFRKGEISEEEYRENVKAFIRDCIALQEEIGLDVLVHGEFERNDMVEFFGENLEGFVFTRFGWVQSYGTRGVKPPIVFGDIRRRRSITTEWIAYAQSLTKKPVKGMLTGPVTILNWSFPREDISRKEQMFQIGLVIRKEVLELEAAGIRIIQIDEAALREKLPLRKADWNREYLDYAIPAFRLCHAKVQPQTQIHTHMCYSEFEDIIPAIDAMDADVITFEASRSKLTILDSLKENRFETEVGPGVYDIHSPRVPGVPEIKEALRRMMQKIPVKNLWVNPDCGLKTRGPEETKASLCNLVQAAVELREELASEGTAGDL